MNLKHMMHTHIMLSNLHMNVITVRFQYYFYTILIHLCIFPAA